jgi:NADPH2:quinone reductase
LVGDQPVHQVGPHTAPGEVLIQVRAAGANPVDDKMYSGASGQNPALLPMRLGREAAGVVADVGDRPEGPAGSLHPGDEVVAFPIQGAYAGELVVPASSAAPA